MSNILPVNRSKHSARRFYDRISHSYDWLTASETKLIQKGVDILSPSPEEMILDIGSGTGAGMRFIAEDLAGEGTLFGLDLSHKMIITSLEKLKDFTHLCYLAQGDGAQLPLTGGIFDAVFCSFTLELFSKEEISVVLLEIQRVLKPEGRLVVISLSQEPRTLPERLYEVAHQIFPTMLDCRPIPLLDLLLQSGFRILYQEKYMDWGLPIQIALCKANQPNE